MILSTQGSVVLQEQKDKELTIELIANMLKRLAMLYQVPNFMNENAVLLAQWIMQTYLYETLEVVVQCLEKPPATVEKNWRLTPDTIQIWFKIKLDEIAKEREYEYQKEKKRLKEMQADPETNWPDFKKLLSGTWYEDAEKGRVKEAEYQKFKEDRAKSEATKEETIVPKVTSSLEDYCSGNLEPLEQKEETKNP